MGDKRVTVMMPYPGKYISVNHYLGRRRNGGQYVRPEARSWMDLLGWIIKAHHVEDWRLPLQVTCSGVFEDERSAPDLSNLAKAGIIKIWNGHRHN